MNRTLSIGLALLSVVSASLVTLYVVALHQQGEPRLAALGMEIAYLIAPFTYLTSIMAIASCVMTLNNQVAKSKPHTTVLPIE